MYRTVGFLKGQRCAQVVYSEFLDLVKTGNVQQARIDESLQKVYFSVQPRPVQDMSTGAPVASTSGMCPTCFPHQRSVHDDYSLLSHPHTPSWHGLGMETDAEA